MAERVSEGRLREIADDGRHDEAVIFSWDERIMARELLTLRAERERLRAVVRASWTHRRNPSPAARRIAQDVLDEALDAAADMGALDSEEPRRRCGHTSVGPGGVCTGCGAVECDERDPNGSYFHDSEEPPR